MRRYRIEGVSENDSLILIEGDSFHHICGVCRQDKGSHFEVLTENGWALLVEIVDMKKKSATAQVKERRQIPPLKKPLIHLAISIPKISTFENILEKSVELGVYQVHPFFSDYSFVKNQKDILKNKMQRFEKIMTGATQQTGRGDLMKISDPVDFLQILKKYQSTPNSQAIFAYEGEGGQTLKKTFTQNAKPGDNLWIFVGSEGGFSTQEVEIFKKINLFPISLGQQVLRVETACVTLLGIIKYELDLF